LFDFTAIEIRAATKFDVEAFVVQVVNDTDPARPWKKEGAGKLPCRVAMACKLPEASLNMLKDHFDVLESPYE
jgi:hypothetical protein